MSEDRYYVFELRVVGGRDKSEDYKNLDEGWMSLRIIGSLKKGRPVFICPKCFKVHSEFHKRMFGLKIWCPHCGWSE